MRCGIYVTVGCPSVRPSVRLFVPSIAAAFRSISQISVAVARVQHQLCHSINLKTDRLSGSTSATCREPATG